MIGLGPELTRLMAGVTSERISDRIRDGNMPGAGPYAWRGLAEAILGRSVHFKCWLGAHLAIHKGVVARRTGGGGMRAAGTRSVPSCDKRRAKLQSKLLTGIFQGT